MGNPFLFEDFSEPLVDCDKCQVYPPLKRDHDYNKDIKCCDFQPFVSAFSAGLILLKNPNWLESFSENKNLIFLPVGIVPNLTYRALHKEARKNNRLSVLDLACSYYDHDHKNCSIWQFRPQACGYFYCASRGGSTQLKNYILKREEYEAKEAHYLKLFCTEMSVSQSDWIKMIDFLDEETTNLNIDKLVLQTEDAKKFYLQSQAWLKAQMSS